jgi:hypothetical protein
LGGAPSPAGLCAGLGSFVPFSAALKSNNPPGPGFADEIVELRFKDAAKRSTFSLDVYVTASSKPGLPTKSSACHAARRSNGRYRTMPGCAIRRGLVTTGVSGS